MNQIRKIDLLLFLFVIGLFFYLNCLIPYCWDDFGYAFMCQGRNHDFSHPIHTLSDAFWSQIDHYQSNTGRFPIHVAVQLLCGLGNKIWFNILMALMAIIWILLLQKLCMPKLSVKTNIPTALGLTFLFSIFNTGQGAFYSGVAFGMNYLYGTLICMLYIYFLDFYKTENFWRKIVLCIVGFLSGWSQELIAIGIAAYVFVWLIQNWQVVNKTQIASISLFYIGVLLLVFAPGNFVRQGEHNTGWSLTYLLPFVGLFGLIALYLWFRQRSIAMIFTRKNLPLIAAWLILIIFFIVLRVTLYGRMLVGIQLFGFILMVRLALELGYTETIRKYKYLGATACICFSAIIVYLQITPSKQMKEFYALCENPNVESVNYVFHQQYCPPFLNRYIFRFKNEEYWDPLYSIRYRKPIVMNVENE